jgi:hypothetical protein
MTATAFWPSGPRGWGNRMNRRVLRKRYEIGETLGGGSGSTTFAAHDRSTGTRCVVKELSVGEVVRSARGAHSLDPDDFTKLVQLFEREARVLANLDHPGIPRFVDHFTESRDGDTRLFTVQEHIDGRTLEALVREGRHFTEAEAREVCRQVGEILAYLHGRTPALIHRDIKPSNLILDEQGTVHLVDFGSVRDALGADELDGRTVVGTYGYMPIEQYEARALPQSDLYALGMTLVYLVTHREPTQIPRSGMRLEFRKYANVSPAFAGVLERMIEAAPEDRYRSADELLAALARLDRSSSARAWTGSRRPLAAARAAATVALVGLGAGVTWLAPDMAPPLRGVSTLEVDTEPLPGGLLEPVRPVDGTLTVNLYRDFRYRPVGWPMGRSVGQSALPTLGSAPAERLRVPEEWRASGAEVHYGFFPLGNGPDKRISFALVRGAGGWALHVDENNNESLVDDGPPTFNEGSGPLLAAQVSVEVNALTENGESFAHPYHLWTWFDRQEAGGPIRGRFYARNHFSGLIEVGDETFDATAFEFSAHDALYRESGLCIDLDRDGECQEQSELFFDGEAVGFPGATVRLALSYP